MRAASWLAVIAAAGGGCLPSFRFICETDAQCQSASEPDGRCEPDGNCSFVDAACSAGRRYAGPPGRPPGECVAAAPVDAAPSACAQDFVAVGGSAHRYKRLANTTWEQARFECRTINNATYLAVPDDATELADLVGFAGSAAIWIGIDDAFIEGTFVTQRFAETPSFLPWQGGEPDNGPPEQDCVMATSTTIATHECLGAFRAICECDP